MKYTFRNTQHYIDLIYRNIIALIGNRNFLYAWWWGVEIKSTCKFWGRTYFKRYPETQILIGENCEFRSNFHSTLHNRTCSLITFASDYNAIIEIGNNCGLSGTIIGAFKYIKIGNNVRCGANTFIFDGDFHLEDKRIGEPKEVIIEDNVWLGINTIIMKGVTIGANSIIGANSVVTSSIPANVIAAGNPCKIIKYLDKNE
jgi:acetyltransferase-like isoleucine patch superfamily enzyme